MAIAWYDIMTLMYDTMILILIWGDWYGMIMVMMVWLGKVALLTAGVAIGSIIGTAIGRRCGPCNKSSVVVAK